MKSVKNLFRGRIGGYRLTDLTFAFVGHPKLFLKAAKNASRRRADIVESGVEASKNNHLRAIEPVPMISPRDLVAELGEKFGVVLISDDESNFMIGVSAANLLSALLFMRFRTVDPQIKIDGQTVNFGTDGFKRRALTQKNVDLSWVGPDMRQARISIEPYFKQDTGHWLSNNTKNSALRTVRKDCLTKPALTHATDLLGGQTLVAQSAQRTIDAVYTWVDHNDPEWVKLFENATDTAHQVTDDAKSATRFHNNDELKYSLRSLRKNAPWINKIFVLTNCSRPDWLNEDSQDIVWVDHSEVLAAATLPTFNSHVIESALHKIPGLSEHFIYLNDDFFLARPITKAFFFDANGTSKSFLEDYGMVSGDVTLGDADYLNAARNSSRLLAGEFGLVATQLHRHTPYALRKSLLSEIEGKWQPQLGTLRQNKFRTENDINLVSFLYHHYAIMSGRAREDSVKCIMVKTMDIHWKQKLQEVAKKPCDTFCINEGGDLPPASDWHTVVAEFLQKTFPEPAPWEK